ncbi:hypothetical protein OAA45_00480 [bacterium]|nr:hypothetical protein [bacterium]
MNLKKSKKSNDTLDRSRALVRFWSSTEYSGFLEGLMRELTDEGFEAEQRFQISEASYRSAKSTPARLFLRFRQYVAYPVQLITALLKRKLSSEPRSDSALSSRPSALCNDVCVVSSNTFYAPLIATYLHPNVVHLVYDLFPEAMIHSGKWTEGTLKVKVVRWITKQTLKRSKTNVFLGERLKDYVESIHGSVDNPAIIAVGGDQALFGLSPKERLGRPESGDLRPEKGASLKTHPLHSSLSTPHSEPRAQPAVLYCGNFGNMHDSETLFEYWRQAASAMADGELLIANREVDPGQSTSNQQHPTSIEIAWQFHCSGPKRAALEAERAQLPAALQQQIHLGGGLDQEAWITTMESADVALVTMSPGSETVVMPSKTYSAMMAGQAILAIAPENSDLVDLIKTVDCGWWLEPGDVAGIEAALKVIHSDPELLLYKRENAFDYAHTNLGQDSLARKWRAILLNA